MGTSSEIATAQGWGREIAAIDNEVVRGLVEWTLSVTSVREHARGLSASRFCEVSYDELVSAPANVAQRLATFLDLERDDHLLDWADNHVARRSRRAAELEIPPTTPRECMELLASIDRGL